jgi:hypothetical protein
VFQLRIGFTADLDPDPAFKVNADPDADPDPIFYDQKLKIFTAENFVKYFYIKFANYFFFLLLWVIFALLNPPAYSRPKPMRIRIRNVLVKSTGNNKNQLVTAVDE